MYIFIDCAGLQTIKSKMENHNKSTKIRIYRINIITNTNKINHLLHTLTPCGQVLVQFSKFSESIDQTLFYIQQLYSKTVEIDGFIPVLLVVCLLLGVRLLREFFSSPEAKAVQHPLKDSAAPPDETGAEVSTKQGWPLSLGRLGTPTDENAIKTNSPADRVPSPVSLLITCSKA